MERYHEILAHATYQKLVKKLAQLEEKRQFCRHDIEHFCDVARIMYILALEEQSDWSQDVIYATALLHDIGRVREYEEKVPHDQASADIAVDILQETGYDQEEIENITEAILGHRDKGKHENELADYLARADHLSRKCFCCPAEEECYWPREKKNGTIYI